MVIHYSDSSNILELYGDKTPMLAMHVEDELYEVIRRLVARNEGRCLFDQTLKRNLLNKMGAMYIILDALMYYYGINDTMMSEAINEELERFDMYSGQTIRDAE